ncbi:adenylate/guanylate cyclase domain-containing protein [Marinibaculum pumilum]|uniref:Adenylate/guanylate cyclase domain-containing protein n=1 Tax=Marinibaculum pumilum TaxID=1766165 RepID=A0ABV7KYZ8_9PROT
MTGKEDAGGPGGNARAASGRRLHLPLYVNIFSIFLVLAMLIVGGVTWFMYRSTADAALETANDLIGEVSDKVGQRTRRLFGTVEALTDATVLLPSLQVAHDPRRNPMLPYLRQLLDSHPTIYSALLGYADGTALQVIAVRGPEMDGLLATMEAPIGTRFIQRLVYLRDDGNRQQDWSFLDAGGRQLGARADDGPAFDPRPRPWFGAAFAGSARYVTEPYTFASVDTLGITMSRRFDGEKPGVFGLDLTLDSLSDFLAEQTVSPEAILAIIDADGHLLAHAEPDLVLHDHASQESDSDRRVHVSHLRDRVLERMHEALPDGVMRRDTHFRFDVDGREYLGTASPLDTTPTDVNLLLVAAPVSDFIGPIERIQRDALIAGGVALLLALPMIWLISRRIAAPLTELAAEAYRIRRLDLAPGRDVHSFILEIDRLARSISTMKGALGVFVRYVPRGLLEEIMASAAGAELGGERRPVTIMFSDITGFTAQSETIEPEELMARTSLYFEEMTRAISDHGGVIDKFIGDAVMALWNAPRPQPDHVATACRGVLAARDRLERFNADLAARGLPPMPTRFGLHSGECVVGNVGSSDRMNYTAIGANVNLAARLEGLAGRYGAGILVSATVRDAVLAHFLFRKVAHVQPKGVAAPLPVYELLAERGEAIAEPLAASLALWEEAMALQDAGDYEGAARLFARRLETAPHDAVAARALERNRRLAASGAGWDGIDRFDEK